MDQLLRQNRSVRGRVRTSRHDQKGVTFIGLLCILALVG